MSTGSNQSQRFGNAVARKSFNVNETNEFAAIVRFLTLVFSILKLKEIAFAGKM